MRALRVPGRPRLVVRRSACPASLRLELDFGQLTCPRCPGHDFDAMASAAVLQSARIRIASTLSWPFLCRQRFVNTVKAGTQHALTLAVYCTVAFVTLQQATRISNLRAVDTVPGTDKVANTCVKSVLSGDYKGRVFIFERRGLLHEKFKSQILLHERQESDDESRCHVHKSLTCLAPMSPFMATRASQCRRRHQNLGLQGAANNAVTICAPGRLSLSHLFPALCTIAQLVLILGTGASSPSSPTVHENDSTNDNSYHEANHHHHRAIATAARVFRVLLAPTRFQFTPAAVADSCMESVIVHVQRLHSCVVAHVSARKRPQHEAKYGGVPNPIDTNLHTIAGTQL